MNLIGQMLLTIIKTILLLTEKNNLNWRIQELLSKLFQLGEINLF